MFKDVEEPVREYDEKEAGEQHKWKAKDYHLLFTSKSNLEIAEIIGLKTAMGVQIKRGSFVMPFLKWKKQNHENTPVSEALIQQFLDEVNP